jgi:hypothetical protein
MSEPDLTAADLDQLAAAGIPPEEARRQLRLLGGPPRFARAVRPCRLGDGIVALGDREQPALTERFDRAAAAGRVVKFVPASGAATRMFRGLLALSAPSGGGGRLATAELAARAEAGDAAAREALRFFERFGDFPFYDDLAAAMGDHGLDLEMCRRRGALGPILDHLLTPAGGRGLDLAAAPKGLIPFHRYPGGERRTAFEEHLVEAAAYARDAAGVCRAHFTVQPEHVSAFGDHLARVGPGFELRYAARFEVGFSTQSHSTDTLAVDLEGRPFRQGDGTLLLRPGGHGALIGNLGALAAACDGGPDLAVVKNVDNVVPDPGKPLVTRWQKLLGGKLLAVQERIFTALDRLEGAEGAASEEALAAALDEAARLLADDLSRPLPPAIAAAPPAERRAVLIERLDRPLRVCGVVRNQGEPGGGPFWAVGRDGEISLQIVESSQIDPDSPAQQAVLAASTHFNPVDLVCGLADRLGRPYRLDDFVDPATVFIAEKDHDGRPLRALERPGLWNGAMAGWNTVFVEIPDATFAPVKTVLDLLRPEHQKVD